MNHGIIKIKYLEDNLEIFTIWTKQFAEFLYCVCNQSKSTRQNARREVHILQRGYLLPARTLCCLCTCNRQDGCTTLNTVDSFHSLFWNSVQYYVTCKCIHSSVTYMFVPIYWAQQQKHWISLQCTLCFFAHIVKYNRIQLTRLPT